MGTLNGNFRSICFDSPSNKLKVDKLSEPEATLKCVKHVLITWT